MTAKALVLYFSYTNGNTEKIAHKAAQALHADIEKIEPVHPYSDDYDAVVAQAQKDVERGYTPDIKPLSHDLSDYDIIAVGTPTWWYTMSSPILTLLSTNDFSKKTVIPFMTNAGWPGNVISDMKKHMPGAHITDEAEFTFDGLTHVMSSDSRKTLEAWTKKLQQIAQ